MHVVSKEPVLHFEHKAPPPTLAWYYPTFEDPNFDFTEIPPQYSLRLLLRNFRVTEPPIQTKDENKMPQNYDLVVCFYSLSAENRAEWDTVMLPKAKQLFARNNKQIIWFYIRNRGSSIPNDTLRPSDSLMDLPHFLILPYERRTPSFGSTGLERLGPRTKRRVFHSRDVWAEGNTSVFPKIVEFLSQYRISDNVPRAMVGIRKMCWYYDEGARFLSTLGPQPSLKKLFANFHEQDVKTEGGGTPLPTGYGVVFYFFSRTKDDKKDFDKMWEDVYTLLTTAQNEIVIVAAAQNRIASEPRRENPKQWEQLHVQYEYRACVVQFDHYMQGSGVKWHADNRSALEEMCSVLYDVDMTEDLAAALKVADT